MKSVTLLYYIVYGFTAMINSYIYIFLQIRTFQCVLRIYFKNDLNDKVQQSVITIG
jgi:hypothetical protein